MDAWKICSMIILCVSIFTAKFLCSIFSVNSFVYKLSSGFQSLLINSWIRLIDINTAVQPIDSYIVTF
jgi:hypothetical protein